MIAEIYVNALGFCGPGIASIDHLGCAFDGDEMVVPDDWAPNPLTLPRRQARRLSLATRTAIAAAEQIAENVPLDAPWIFASSCGEGDTLNTILAALCQPEVMLQPVRFQNAVHNAAQGQFSIVAGSTGPATSIAAFDDTVAAGLLKCVMQILAEDTACGFVAFDEPLPPPLHERRPYDLTLAGALALSPLRADGTLAKLEITMDRHAIPSDPSTLAGPPSVLSSNNPVRFMLPLMAAILGKLSGPVVLTLPGDGRMRIEAQDLRGA